MHGQLVMVVFFGEGFGEGGGGVGRGMGHCFKMWLVWLPMYLNIHMQSSDYTVLAQYGPHSPYVAIPQVAC